MILLIYISLLLQVYWTALVWSDFCPVHPGSDYPCLPITPVLLPHAKGVNGGWHYLSDRSLEPGTTPTQKNSFGHGGITWWKMPENLWVYIFHLIIHFSHWNGMTADKELYWTIAESRIISLVLETRSNGYLVVLKSHHTSGLGNANTMYSSSFGCWSFLISRNKSLCCMDVMVFNL